ncbi:MAG: glutathione S-transferase [Caulobacteraceae bacterium]|nr:glutathione S-transferase [Caulobacteraceae bacterium]
MPLTLYYHPLSSYCWKALIGLYENGVAFDPVIVDLGDASSRAAFQAIWPAGKFPVLKDGETVVPEATVILEYLDSFHPGPVRFVPSDPGAAWRTRLADRVFDLHLHQHMQRIVADRLRPADDKDPYGVADERTKLVGGYRLAEHLLADGETLSGGAFGLAECAAFPALHYGDKVHPIGPEFPRLRAYLERLTARPSVQRVLDEAQPYFQYFPTE